MPLSEHEERLLSQIAQALKDEDPKFADSLGKSRRDIDRRGVGFGLVGLLLGLVLLVGGVATQLIILGLAGFGLMLLGAFLAYRSLSRSAPQDPSSAVGDVAALRSPKPARKQRGSGFMSRLEQRWQQRKERGQY